ncbi:transglutaminase-like cysteine peptidase [Salinarimonas ramus]|uniref:Transglutaminase n=1 Tax=Salinarimonas ramus TaxID=690164 RepID=A0A917Q943_9HYPH|nr:transglutaminase-like cysteine peptidase [Salinarimonas ramus]GGK37405.1 transglutaminase [Salinarimonas ramus]
MWNFGNAGGEGRDIIVRLARGMRKIAVSSLFVAGGFLALVASPAGVAASPFPEPSYQLATTGGARPVPAWSRFCQANPAECSVDPSEPEAIVLTERIWRTIVSVNRDVNRRIRPMTDQQQWNVVDSWDFPETGYGDCEDYQLLKRARLADAGIPRRAMRMTVVLDENNEGHAVLAIRTDRGDMILDNKVDAVKPWGATGYTYIKREGATSQAWVSLGGVTSPVTVATAQ